MHKRRNFLGAWHAKQYDGRPRKNPLFAHREILPRTKIILAAMGGVMVVIGGVWLGFASPWMTLGATHIEGLTTIPPERITSMVDEQRSYRRWFIFSQNNLLAFDEQKTHDRLMADFNFDSLSLSVDGKTVNITAKEKILEIAVQSAGKTFFLGLDGSVVREATPEESKAIDVRLKKTSPVEGEILPTLQPAMPILVDQSESELPEFSAEKIETILELNILLREHGVTPRRFLFSSLQTPWMRIETEEGYAVLFDLEKDFGTQMTSLHAILAQKVNPEDPYEYIDVRFGDHVYVK